MGLPVTILLGIGIALLGSLLIWALIFFMVSPRISILILRRENQPTNGDHVVRLTTSARFHKAFDLSLVCTLNVPHSGGLHHIIDLPLSTKAIPVLERGHSRKVTIIFNPNRFSPEA